MQWTESDKALTKPCVGLIKTTKSLLKKTTECVQTNGQTKLPTEVQELDRLAELTERLSPAVDDLIMDLYPPVDKRKVQDKVWVCCTSCIMFYCYNDRWPMEPG